MRAFKEEPIYLVADMETGLVLTRVSSASCASAVTSGLLNTMSLSLPTQLSHRRHEWDACNFNRDLYQILKGVVTPFPEDLIREDLLKRREISKIRGAYIYSLEIYCQQALTRIANYMPTDLYPFIQNELRICDHEHGIYTQAIEEYAALQEIEPSVAFMELQLQLQSSGIVKFRNYALYEKYIIKMNSCETREELEKVHDQACVAMIQNAKI